MKIETVEPEPEKTANAQELHVVTQNNMDDVEYVSSDSDLETVSDED